MRRTGTVLITSFTLASSVAFGQAPSTSSDMIAPTEEQPGIRVAPSQGAAQQPVQQLPPPPPQGAPWAPPGGPQGVVVMQPPPGYVYQQPVMYGAPMMAVSPLTPYDGGPIPPGARLVTRPRTGLIVGGSVMFGTTWLTSLLVSTMASSSRENGIEWLAVPAIGPLIAGGAMRGVSTTGWTVLILDTLLQGGGLAMMIYGITHPGQYLSYDVPQQAGARPGVRWAFVPGHAGGPGASFALRF